jgi:hypothetical protein
VVAKAFRILLFSSVLPLAWCQTFQSALQVTRVYGVTSPIDNRSSLRQNNYHSFCAKGTGTWSAQLQYSDTGIAGPYTNFPDASALVNQGSSNCLGSGFAYHAFIKILTSGTITLLNYSAAKDFYIAASGGGGGGGGTVTASSGALTLNLPVFGNGGTDIKVGTVTGTGTQLVASQSPTIVTPTIASFTNAQHDHSNAAGGGQIASTSLSDTANLIRTSTTLGGDLTGTLPNPVVAKINGVALSGLATGILKNTTTTGVPSIASAGTDYVVPAGNVATATALASAPTKCSAGSYTIGIDVSGNAQSCTVAALGTVTAVTFPTTPAGGWLTAAVATGTTTPAISLTATGGLTQNQFIATPNGSSGAVSLRSMVAADVPQLTATQMPAFTGDATSSAGAVALTLATVNSGSGLCGDATHVCQITTNAKGLVTLQAQVVTGAVTGPGSSTNTNVPQWNGTSGLALSAGLGVVTTVGSPGSNSNLATEAAVRTAITAGTAGVTGPGTTVVGVVPQWGNTLGTSLSAGLAVSATSANNVLVESGASGTIDPGFLPNPSASTLGGVQSLVVVSHKWINTISTSGVPAATQPAFTDISGTASAAQLPNPSASTLGGIESYVAVSNQWINAISTSGVPSSTQPAFTNISGTLGAGQFPSLTGDITTPGGSLATTLATVNAGPGACGDTTHVCQVTTNGKGLVTSQTAVVISAPGTGTVTDTGGLGSNGSIVITDGAHDVKGSAVNIDGSGNITAINSLTSPLFQGSSSGPTVFNWVQGTAPATPSGIYTLSLYQDSTTHHLSVKYTDGSVTDLQNPSGVGGTVTNVTFPVTPSGGWLTASVATGTTTPAISLTATGGMTQNQFIATPDGAPGAVGLRSIVANDIPLLTGTQMPALTGDVTTPGGSLATTLATVNSGPGLCGDATHVCQITTNGKGLVTLQSAVSVTGSLANLALSNLASVNINTALGFQSGVDIGTTTKPARDLYLYGSATYGTNYFRITGNPTTIPTVITLPNLGSQTLATLSGTETLTGKTLVSPSLGSSVSNRYFQESYTNDGTTGTVTNRAVTNTGVSNTVIVLPDNASDGAIGVVVSGAGVGGTAQVVRMGVVPIVFTNTAVAGHWAQWATGAGNGGKATDTGLVASTSFPQSNGQVVGVVQDGGAAGLHNVELQLRTMNGAAGPTSVTSGNIPQWNGTNGLSLTAGLGFVTTVGSPGLDTNIPSEKAIRAAITSAVSGVASVNSLTGALTIANGTYTTVVSGGGTITLDADTTKLATQTTVQNGTPWAAIDAGSSGTTYSVTTVPAFVAYTDGMALLFRPNTACAGGASTLNANAVGAIALVQPDGASNPTAGECVAKITILVTFNQSLKGGAGAWVLPR